MTLGERIAQLRQDASLTQEELAAQVGVTRQAVSHWERGQTEPDLDTLGILAAALFTPVSVLLDLADVQFTEIAEGRCVQCLHVGPYDDEPATVAAMDAYAAEQGLALDFSDTRRHHEIYLSDARRTTPERLRTVIRHPVRSRR